MLINTADLDYMRECIAAIDAGKIIAEDRIICPECDQDITDYWEGHMMYRKGNDLPIPRDPSLIGNPILLIACQGYHTLRDALNALK